MNVIALDISKDTADCHLSGNGKEDTLKIDNSISGSLQLLGWIKQHKIRKCVISMEATGIYYETLANHLSQYHQVYVINPLKIKNYSKAFFNRTKTEAFGQIGRLPCTRSRPIPFAQTHRRKRTNHVAKQAGEKPTACRRKRRIC